MGNASLWNEGCWQCTDWVGSSLCYVSIVHTVQTKWPNVHLAMTQTIKNRKHLDQKSLNNLATWCTLQTSYLFHLWRSGSVPRCSLPPCISIGRLFGAFRQRKAEIFRCSSLRASDISHPACECRSLAGARGAIAYRTERIWVKEKVWKSEKSEKNVKS